MASPQIEDGYVRIANELLDAMLATEFTGREFRVLLSIIRYSYGWNKKEAFLTVRQLHQVTGLSGQHASTIYKTLRRLILANVIKQTADYTYQLNKDYTSWQIDQRRYKPLEKETSVVEKHATDCGKACNNFCKSGQQILEKHATNSQPSTPLKSAIDEGSKELAQSLHKDIFKDIYKDISLRERIFERLKSEFSGQPATNEQQLKALVFRYPERADFFLYLCETFKINPVYVKNPIAYITSLRPIAFPDLKSREEVKKEAEKKTIEEKALRQKEVNEYIRLESEAMKKLASSFVKTL